MARSSGAVNVQQRSRASANAADPRALKEAF